MLNFKKLLFGFLFSLLISAALTALCAFVILKLGYLPSDAILGTIAAILGGISVFAAGLLVARSVGERGLLHGFFLGAAYAILYVALGIMFYANIQYAQAIIRGVIFVVCSVCGGVLGVNRNEKVRF